MIVPPAFPRFTPSAAPHLGQLLSRNDARLTADTLGHRRPATTVVGAPVDAVVSVTRCRYAMPIASREAVCGSSLCGIGLRSCRGDSV